EEFGWNRTEIAGATSLGAVLGAALAPFIGRLMDRFGARMILVGGGLVVVLGCMYLSMAQALAGFYVAFTAVRIADQGLIQIGASVSVGKWFLRRRGRAVGLVFFGGSLGMIVMAPVVQFVITNWDWRIAWVVLASVMLCIGVIPSALFIRRQPEDMGLVIEGADERTHVGRWSDARRDEQQTPLSEVMRTPAFWLILVSLFLASSAISGVGLHLVPHLTQQGLSPTAAVAAVSVMAISGAVAALVSGVLAETVSVKLLLMLAYLLGAASMWTLIHADTLTETYLFAVMQGFLGTGVNTLAPILWASYYGRRSLGGIFGMSRAAQVFGFAVGPLVSAVVFDSTGSYRGAFISLGLVAILASALLWTARRPASAP
ncbi:MAG: MFS transporter, partial [Dehalococcoidia bacterium]|nr:MFS transporter [Dehalococcoidia bacterium]